MLLAASTAPSSADTVGMGTVWYDDTQLSGQSGGSTWGFWAPNGNASATAFTFTAGSGSLTNDNTSYSSGQVFLQNLVLVNATNGANTTAFLTVVDTTTNLVVGSSTNSVTSATGAVTAMTPWRFDSLGLDAGKRYAFIFTATAGTAGTAVSALAADGGVLAVGDIDTGAGTLNTVNYRVGGFTIAQGSNVIAGTGILSTSALGFSQQELWFSAGFTTTSQVLQTLAGGATDATQSAAITTSTGLRKTGTATYTLTSTAGNSIAGDIFVEEGGLRLTTAASGNTSAILGSGQVFLSNANFLATATSQNTATMAGAILTINTAAGNATLNNAVEGAGRLDKEGANTLFITSTNSFSGELRVLGGTVSVASVSNIGSTSAIGRGNSGSDSIRLVGGTFEYTGAAGTTNRTFGIAPTGGTILSSGTGALSITGAGSIGFNGLTGARTLTLGGTYVGDANVFGNLIADNTGATAVTKTGAGIWSLTGANTFTGAVAVNAGTLRAGNASAFGTTAGGVTVADGAVLDLNGQAIGAEALSLTGTGISSGGALINSSGTAASLSGAVTLAANSSVGGSGDLALSGGISGAFTLAKVGAGILTISGTNTNSAAITVSAGTLRAGSASALGTTAAGTSVTSGAVLDLNGQTIGAEAVSVNGAGISSGGALINSSGTASLSGAVTLATSSSVGGAGNLTLSGGISGGAAIVLTKVGAGSLTLSGNSAATFSGNVVVSAGTLVIGNLNGLGAFKAGRPVSQVTVSSGAAVDFNGVIDATYGYTISGTGTAGGGALLNNGAAIGNNSAQASNITLAADASIGGTNNWALINNSYAATTVTLGGFTLTKVGANTVSFANTTFTAGNIRISAGGLALTNSVSAGTLASVALTLDNVSGANFNQAGYAISLGSLAGGGSTGGNYALGGGTLTVGGSNASTAYAGAISGTGAIVKRGTGTLTLSSGSSSYSGATTLSQGALVAAHASAFGSTSAITLGDGTTGAGNLSLSLNATTGELLMARPVVVSTSGTGTVTLGSATTGGSSIAAFTGGVTLNRATIIDGGSTGDRLGFAGSGISGSGAITIAGTNRVVFNAASGNAHTGNVTISSGATLQLGDGATNASSLLADTATIAVAGTLSLAKNGNVEEVAAISGAGTIRAIVGADTLQVGGDNSNSTFSGTLTQSGSGSLALSKVGAGTLTLSGSNSLSGGITVSGGSLVGTTSSLVGNITNNAAVTFDQSTSGTYAGNLSGAGALTKSGAGVVTLSGSNSHSGGTTISAGGLVGTTSSLVGAITNNAALTFDQSTDGTYAGVISGSGTLTKLGNGVITLSGSLAHSGGTTISAGRLVGTTSSLAGAIANNAALTFDQSTDGVYAGVISGTGALTKSGSGMVTLSGANTASGGNAINAGTLLVSGSLAGANSVASGATLAVTGSVSGVTTVAGGTLTGSGTAGAVILQNGATLAAGQGGVGSLTLGNLSVDASAAVNLTISGLTAYTGAAALNMGDITLGSGANVTLNVSGFAIGDDFRLLSYTGSNPFSQGVNLTLNNIGKSGRLTVTLDTATAGVIMYDVTGHSTLWTGATDSSWQTSGAQNWTVDSSPDSYLEDDLVVFGAGAANRSITLGSDVTPGSFRVEGSDDYAFSGAYAIKGTGALTKTGNGKLTLGTANTFSGGANLQGGRIALGSNSALGTGTITLSGATLSSVGSAARSLANAVVVSGDVTLGHADDLGSLTFVTGTFGLGGGTRTLTTVADVTLSGIVSDGGLIKAGDGTLTLGNTNTHAAGTTLAAGRLRLGADAAAGTGTLTLSGGTLSSVGSAARSLANAVELSGDVTLGHASDTGSLAFSGAVGLGGGTRALATVADVTLSGVVASGGLSKSGAGALTLSGANTFAGGLTVTGGSLRLGSDAAAGTGTLALDAGTTVSSDGAAARAIANALVLSGDVTLGDASRAGALSFSSGVDLGGGRSLTVASAVTLSGVLSNGSLTKAGAGTLTLSGANSYAGGTTIDAGTLALGASNRLADAGAVAVNAGATLDLTGFAETVGSLTVSGGTVAGGTLTTSSVSATSGTVTSILAGSSSLQKTGAGTLVLSAANTYSGTTTVSEGVLQVGANGATGSLGSGAVSIASGATLAFNRASGANDVGLTITGSGAITTAGTGEMSFTGNLSGFTGTLAVNGAKVAINGLNAGSGFSAVSIGAGSTLSIGSAFAGQTLTLRNLSGAGNVDTAWASSNDTRTLAVQSTAATTLSGVISDAATGSRVLALQKTGSETLTLTGTNTYTGATTVSAGMLQIGNGGAAGEIGSVSTTSILTVASGATLRYYRSGSLNYTSSARLRTVAGAGTIIIEGTGVGGASASHSLTISNAPGVDTGYAEANSWSNFTGSLVIKGGAEYQTTRNGSTAMGTSTVTLGDATTSGGLASIQGNWSWINNIVLAGPDNVIRSRSTGSDRTLRLFGAISGSGKVTFDDATGAMGNVDRGFMLIGNNTMSGDIVVNGIVRVGALDDRNPTLAFAAGSTGSLGSGNVAINSGKVLAFTRTNAITASNVISGAGKVHIGSSSVLDAGNSVNTTANNTYGQVVTLTGANSYSGGTELLRGTLVVSDLGSGGNIGSGYLAVKGGSVAAQSGTFRYTGASVTTSRALWVNDGRAIFDIADAAATVAFTDTSGTIGGANGNVITKTGLGTLELADAITAGGSTALSVSQGRLRLTAANTAAISTTIASGATLEIGGSGTLTTAPVAANGALELSTSASFTLGGALTGSGSLSKTGAGAVVISGSLGSYTGTLGVSAGTLTLSGISAYSGNVAVDGGELILSDNNTFTGSVAVGASGTLRVGAGATAGFIGNAATVTNNGALVFNRSNDTNVGTVISGAGSVSKQGVGALNLTGNSSISGTVTIGAGTLRLGNGGTAGSIGTGDIVNNATLALNRSDTLTLGNLVSGTGALTQIGSGTSILTAANTYSGTTTISTGTLQVGNGGTSGSLGSGAVTNNAALVFNRSDSHSVANVISGTGSLTQSGNGTLTLTAANTYSGATTIDSGKTLEIGGAGTLASSAVAANGTFLVNSTANFTLASGLTGTGVLAKSNTGTLTIGSANNEFAGSATVDGGKLVLGHFDALGGRGITVATGGTLDLDNRAVTSAITLAGGSLEGFGSYSGTITATGTNSLDGAIAATFVNSGTTTTTTGLTFTGTLKGTGTINGNVTVSGDHNPGNSPGIQTINGNLTYSNNADVQWELTANTALAANAGVEFDRIIVNGDLSFGSPVFLTLVFNGDGSDVNWTDAFWNSARSWLVYDVSGTTSFGGLQLTDAIESYDGKMVVNNVDDGRVGTNTLVSVRQDAAFYLGQVGNDIRLFYRPIPEPSTYGLMLGGLALAGAALRRRRAKRA